MRLAFVGLAILLAVPAAQACSLAYQPFEAARFHDDGLWYVAGDALRHVDGAVESTEVEAFFLSYARLDGARLLVAGQDGLGADCSGDLWLELRDGADVVWRRAAKDEVHVFPHPLGPFVQMDGRFWRLDGDDLVAYDEDGAEDWVVGWTPDGQAVRRVGDVVRIGERTLPSDVSTEPIVATHDDVVAIGNALRRGGFEVRVIDGDDVSGIQWQVEDGWGPGMAFAGGWLVAAGGRAYLVTDTVVDLGVDDARAVSERAGQGIVFVDDGYVVFEGTDAVEAWRRNAPGTLWAPAAPETDEPREVPSESTGPAPWTSTEGPDPDTTRTATGDDILDVPSVWPALLVVGVLAAAAIRRRR